MHYDKTSLTWQDWGNGWKGTTVTLVAGDTAWNPSSSKPENVIHGPAVVTYERSRASMTVYVD